MNGRPWLKGGSYFVHSQILPGSSSIFFKNSAEERGVNICVRRGLVATSCVTTQELWETGDTD